MADDLNEIEEMVLREFFKSSEGNGHDFGFADEINTDKIGITRKQLSGYISQLSQKGYIHVFDSGGEKWAEQIVFTRKGFMFFGLTGYADRSEY